MFIKLKKVLKNPLVLGSLIIAVIVILLFTSRKESFAKMTRYMWLYNGIPRNSSYQTRGEPIFYDKDTSKTGIFNESSLDANETNQRVRPAYQRLRMDVDDSNNQHNILDFSTK